jgi:GWxTD domain-containing protein
VRRRGLFAALAGAALLAAACGPPGEVTPHHTAALNNTYLSPALSQWLIGAISQMASPEEVRAYLELRDDATAESFIEAFWGARDADPSRPGNPLRELFEQRERDADRRFSEAGYLGRRTDRGRTYVLYGDPAKADYEINPHEGDPPVERWVYGTESRVGLNRRRPAPVYRFVKRGDLTVFYAVPISQRGTLLEPPG